MTGDRMGPIENWMRQQVANAEAATFDDLHIDEISPDLTARASWPEGSIRALGEAIRLRDLHAWACTLALGISLETPQVPTGPVPAPETLRDVWECVDWTPPSLYIFPEGDLSWLGGSQGSELGPKFVPPELPGVRAFLREWRDPVEGGLRRSFWLVA